MMMERLRHRIPRIHHQVEQRAFQPAGSTKSVARRIGIVVILISAPSAWPAIRSCSESNSEQDNRRFQLLLLEKTTDAA